MNVSRFTVPALIAGTFFSFLPLNAGAVTTATRTINAGTTLHTALGQSVDSRTLTVGQSFTLLIDEPTIPAVDRAQIHGHVTDVQQPSGLDRARIGFVLTNIVFPNGKKASIHAQVMSKYVTYIDPAAVKREQDRFKLPAMPMQTKTPGPIAWQMTFRPGQKGPSITPPPSASNGGYVYAANSNENVVIPAGTPVTIKLTSNLELP